MLEFKDWRPEALQAVHAPTMIMMGDGDIVRPEHAVEMFRLLPHAQLAILPGVDLMTFVKRADWQVSMIEAFLGLALSKGERSMKRQNEVRHISVFIHRSPQAVYEFASKPENLPKWATGLGGNIEDVNGEWIADSSIGRIKIRMADHNRFGVLDHDVTLESGVVLHNPMRVVPHGNRSEVIFTFIRQSDMTDEQFTRDAQWVEKDLTILRDLLEKAKP